MTPSPIFTFEEYLTWVKSQPPPKPYISRNKPKPDHVWFQLPKAETETCLRIFCNFIIESLEGAPDSDKELAHLLVLAKTLSRVSRSPPISIAFIVPQAAGKSLLLCALFELDGLSLTGSEGRACTSAVIKHEFYEESEDGENRVHGLVKFLDAPKLTAMFSELCRHYYNYHHAGEDSDDEDE